jgi:predicted RNase H-like nuclease
MTTTVVGVDGCRAGWYAVAWNTEENRFCGCVLPQFKDVLVFSQEAQIVAVDMPIGLLDHALPGGRICDVYARKLLHPNRMSSVFSAPVRTALEAETYAEALALNRDSSHHDRGLSKQCFGIFPKIREVDQLMTPDLQQRVREIHPELGFSALNGGFPLGHAKRTPEGRAERLDLLVRAGFAPLLAQMLGTRLEGAEPDDLLDACAACWSARRIAEGRAERIPPDPRRDAKGLSMQIWY